MDDVPDARTLSEESLAAMLAAVEPSWELRAAEPADGGFCTVYRVEVEAADGCTRDLYLKASPDGEPWGIPTEARLQAVLAAETPLPVPDVAGAVDDHHALPTPYFVMAARPGAALPYEQVCRLDDDVLRRLARETGAHLATLHGVPAPDAFGHVRHDGPVLAGGRPAGDPATLTVGDPRQDWRTALRSYADRELERHAESPFATLTPELRRWVDARIEALEGPFEPALGRNDHGLHNLLVDPETGSVTGVLDWGYTLVVPPAFDVEFAAYIYSGGYLAGLPGVRDRRSLVRRALLAGYREAVPDGAGAVESREPLYELLAMVRVMNDVDALDLPDGREGDVHDRIAADARALLGEYGE